MITIGQIAEMAEVSKSTVSRVLNSSGYVHENTRNKIEAIIKEYHYSPSATAQNLSRRETNTIGIIIPEVDNPFFGEVLEGISGVIDQNNYTMILCNTGNDGEKEKKVLSMLEQQRVKGVIFAPAIGYSDAKAARSVRVQLKNLHIPVVLVDREIENAQWDGVFYENFQSGYLAAERLIKKGSKKIGIITGDMNLKHARDRYQGYAQALEDHHLPVEEQYVFEGNYMADRAYEIALDMFRQGKEPEGLVLCNNATTLGFLRALRECKKKLDRDIQAVGIDHIAILDTIGYQYECVTRDAKGMGRKAMELLMERFENPGREKRIYVVPCIEKFQD